MHHDVAVNQAPKDHRENSSPPLLRSNGAIPASAVYISPNRSLAPSVSRSTKMSFAACSRSTIGPTQGTDGPSWLTFIGQFKDSLWSTDLFRCESILLRSHWVLVVMDLFTRRIIGFGVEPANIDRVSACRMFNHAIADQRLPKHLSTDHDPLFRFHRWLANLRVLDIEEIKSIPYVPVSHPFVERLIGTIRREYLDRVLFYNSLDLMRKLEAFRTYYNGSRVHQSLGGSTPEEHSSKPPPARAALDSYGWRQHCHGLIQTPIAA